METIIIFTNKTELSDYGLGDFELTNQLTPIVKTVDETKKIALAFDGSIDDIRSTIDLERINELIPVGDVYILHHTSPNAETLELLKSKLKIKGIKEENIHVKLGAHTDANTYGLIKKIDANGNPDLNEVFESFKLAIAGDPYLESLICLHKTLSISQISNSELTIENLDLQDKYKLAFELLGRENGNKKIEEVLKWTASKIPELSK